MKTDAEILKYLTEEEKCEAEVVAPLILKKLTEYDDIAAEFMEWLEERKCREKGAVEVSGWTAKKVVEKAPWMEGAGVFNFLVSLRDDPEEAKEIIERKFAL